MKLHTPSLGTALGATALILSLGGIAAASIPGSDGTIEGCYDTSIGPPYPLTIVDSSAGCKPPGVLLPFNQQGPAGQTGATGPTGAAGPPGIASAVYGADNSQQSTFIAGGQEQTVRLPLPAGAYAVTARAAFMPLGETEATCVLVARDSRGSHDADGQQLFSGSIIHTSAPNHVTGQDFVAQAQVDAPLQITTTLVSDGGVELSCRPEHDVTSVHLRVMAVRVASVDTFRPTAAAESALRARPPLPRKLSYPHTIKLPPPTFHQR